MGKVFEIMAMVILMIAMFKFVPLMVKIINGMKDEYDDIKEDKRRPTKFKPNRGVSSPTPTKKNNFKKGIDSDFL
jgi:hypothetical protein